MQFSAEYVYAVTGGQEVPEGSEMPDTVETFIEFMNRRTAELGVVSVELAETLAENEWFAAEDGDTTPEPAAVPQPEPTDLPDRESYLRACGFTDAEAHAAAVDDLAPASN